MKKWRIIFFTLGVGFWAVISSCSTIHLTGAAQVNTGDSLKIAELDTLYASISVRDANGIILHTQSPYPIVRRLAWRSLHVTEMPIDTLFNLVEHSNDDHRWFSLAGHVLNRQILDSLSRQWLANPGQRSGIGLVLGMQGNRGSLDFISKNIHRVEGDISEYQNALALSRLLIKHPDYPTFYPSLIHRLLISPDSIRHAYLYAAYRSQRSVFPETLDDQLINNWKAGLFVHDRLTRQMIIHILATHQNKKLFTLNHPGDLLKLDVNEANEWIDALGYYPANDATLSYYQALLQYPYQSVLGNLLDSITRRKIHNPLLMDHILAIADSNRTSDPYLFVKAIKASASIIDTLSNPYTEELQKAVSRNKYLLGDVLRIRSKLLSKADYFRNIVLLSLDQDAYTSEQAIGALSEYWQRADSLARDTLLPDYSSVISQLMQYADRGVTATLPELLSDSVLVKNVSFEQIHHIINQFDFPGDIESIEAMTPVLRNNFGKKGMHLIDSLASLGYPPYNRFLISAGYRNIPKGRPGRYPLYRPDFIRLALLGRHSTWQLHTTKGTIIVRLNAYSAPATVTLIDSLSRSSAYKNIPFHRVVPDFVIQGGDIERGDGFGGTATPLPTEPSELDFDRGAAGIASAGPDTEGPQFFFMHQWKPHLNGKYTRFGYVIDGMDVVDKIIPGDRVISDTLVIEN